MNRRSRVQSLDIFRGIAVLLVVVHHANAKLVPAQLAISRLPAPAALVLSLQLDSLNLKTRSQQIKFSEGRNPSIKQALVKPVVLLRSVKRSI